MSEQAALHVAPRDRRALIAVDLGAESCRVSMLRWRGVQASIQVVHRFGNAPREEEGGLRWDLGRIAEGVEEGLRRCAALAGEGVRSIAVDGWAVDYVRVDEAGTPIEDPFCYRDERTVGAEPSAHALVPAERLRAITGIQIQRINTLYQLHADTLAEHATGARWLNLPEYFLARWGGAQVAERTNAAHTGMMQLDRPAWSREIFDRLGLDMGKAAPIVPPGTCVGRVAGALAALEAFRHTVLIAPACHDTASAIAGIPASGEDWAYLSSGTWSLVGATLDAPRNGPGVRADNFTNLAGVGGCICFHKGVNGMWLLRQCMDSWAAEGMRWEIEELIAAAESATLPVGLLEVDDPELLHAGEMPSRIGAQRRRMGLPAITVAGRNAPQVARLIFASLAARYAGVLERVAFHTGKTFRRLVVVGGGSRNALLNRITAEATGLEVCCGSAESATLGNFAVQLAVLEDEEDAQTGASAEAVTAWARMLSTVTMEPLTMES